MDTDRHLPRGVPSDPIRRSTALHFFAAEDAIVGALAHEAPLAEAPASEFIARVYARHACNYLPLSYDPPRLRLRYGADQRGGGYADVRRHEIVLDAQHARRAWLIHECAHVLAPDEPYHGPQFALTLLQLLEGELGIPFAHSLKLAREHGIAVAPITRRSP